VRHNPGGANAVRNDAALLANQEKTMKAKVLAIITATAMLGACASHNGVTNEREYRNPFLKARHIGTAQPPVAPTTQRVN
jgi:hypothetical protein